MWALSEELLFLRARVALGNDFVKLSGLVSDPLGGPLFVPSPGRSGRLLDKLAKIIPQDCNAIFEFRNR
jgi:hypothetical protein